MKASKVLLALSVVLVLAVSCATAPKEPPKPAGFGDVDAAFTDLYMMASDLTSKGGVAAVGMGIAPAGRLDIAIDKAMMDGRVKVAQTFEVKIENLQKKFMEQVGGANQAEVNETFSSVSKSITQKTLTGVVALSKPIQKNDANGLTVAMVVGLDPKTLNSSVLGELQKANENLYARFRATQAFDELQAEMDNYKPTK